MNHLAYPDVRTSGIPSLRADGDIRYLAAHHTRYSQDESHTSRGILGFTFQRNLDRHTEAGSTTLEGTRIQAGGAVTVLANADLEVLPATKSSFVEDVHQSSAALSFHGGIRFKHKVRDTTQTTATTPMGAHIAGDVVVLWSGEDAQLVGASISGAHGVAILASGTVLVEAGQETETSVHEHMESAFGIDFSSGSGRLPALGSLDRIHEAATASAIPAPSQISSGEGNVALAAGRGVAVLGSSVSAAGDVTLSGPSGVLVASAQSVSQSAVFDEASDSWLNTSDGYRDQSQQISLQPSRIDAGGKVLFQSAGTIALGAAEIHSGGPTVLGASRVDFLGETTSSFNSHADWDSDFVYAIHAGRGEANESVSLARIDAGGGIELPSDTAVAVQLDAGNRSLSANELRAMAVDMGAQPGMGWLKDLAERPEVDWQAIQTAHQQWDYRSQGLTEGGAVLITVIVAAVTYGMGTELVGTTTTTMAEGAAATTASTVVGTTATTFNGVTLATGTITAGGTTITTYTAYGAAINAGFTSLAAQATVSFINNGGNLSKTLRDLGSSDTVRGILAAMISSGVAGSFGNKWSFERLLAQTFTGCVASEIAGGKCETGAKWAFGTGALAWSNHYLRQLMNDDSRKSPGIIGTGDKYVLSNSSGDSVGVDGDGFKVAGGRVDLGRICDEGQCLMDDKGNYVLDTQGRVQFIGNGGNLLGYLEAHPEWRSPMGGWQGALGKFAFFDYKPGSIYDRLAEAYAGPHDWLNSFIWYAGNGNIQSGVNGGLLGVLGSITNYTNVLLASPIAVSTLLPPGVLQSVGATYDHRDNEHP